MCIRDSAAGALTRLLDMGVEPYLAASSLRAVVAQRLVRRLCAQCAVEEAPGTEEARLLGGEASRIVRHPGPGCDACRATGYRGRTGIHELLVVDDAVRRLVMARAEAAAIRRHAAGSGTPCLRDDGLDKARRGVTTVAEVLRATQDER